MPRAGILAGLSVLLLLLFAACSDREVPGPATTPGTPTPPTATPSPTATATPTPPPLLVFIRLPRQAHQGIPYEFNVEVRLRAFPAAATVELYLDGQPFRESTTGAGGIAAFVHTFLEAGPREITVRAQAAQSSGGSAAATLTVHPRIVVFIQGMNSASHCPDGRSFATRAPQWLAPHLFEPLNVDGMVLTQRSFAYFSYSGRWCTAGGEYAEGAYADYRAGDTCSSIDGGHAARLREFIESFAPSRVSVVAHSMGGLVTAYLVSSDPGWAREHIASVATVDSPLGGVGGLRVGVVGAGGVFDGDCGPNSAAVRDLWDDSGVVSDAQVAAAIVPFYTSDATSGEGPTFGQVEAVPGGATHLPGEAGHVKFADTHSAAWSSAGDHVEVKRRFVACAVAILPESCLGTAE